MTITSFPADFGHDDIARIADRFDGRMEKVRDFLRTVWLPDAVSTVEQINRECDTKPIEDLRSLCDHLREGGRIVGLRRIVDTADLLFAACERQEPELARALAGSCIGRLSYYSLQLQTFD